MKGRPESCLDCQFRRSCNTGYNMPDCHFYDDEEESKDVRTLIEHLKALFT